MAKIGTDWRQVGGMLTAWFDAASLTQAAALAGRIVDGSEDTVVDVRSSGVRIRVASDAYAEAVSAAARDLGLTADPTTLQHVNVLIDATDPSGVGPFWQAVLGYVPTDDGILADPLRRDPAVRIQRTGGPRSLRNRIHLDVVRPSAAVEGVDAGAPTGPYGVCHVDPEGNEVDLVPGGPISEGDGTADWHGVFGAVACYRTTTPTQQRDLVIAAATLADDAGFPLLIDVRPGLVILDSGKDVWDNDAHGLGVDFSALAERLQGAAREVGATADPVLPRFVQLFLDAADVAAVRAFWIAALGHVPDPRAEVTDIIDPRRLNPVLVFQQLDVSDTERRRQRNRIHIELAVPSDTAPAHLAAAVEAGGRLLEESDGRWIVADPEGNELVIVTGT